MRPIAPAPGTSHQQTPLAINGSQCSLAAMDHRRCPGFVEDGQVLAACDMAAQRPSMHEDCGDVINGANDTLSNSQQVEDEAAAGDSPFRAEAERFAEEWSKREMETRQLQGNCPFESQALRERAAVREFMSGHPLPAEHRVREWLRKSTSGHLPNLRKASGLQSTRQAEALLDYDALEALWMMLAGNALGSKAAVQVAREAGLRLYAHGEREGPGLGQKCLIFHYYALHYIIAGGCFHPRPHEVLKDQELAVALYTCHTLFVSEYWEGIGEWRN